MVSLSKDVQPVGKRAIRVLRVDVGDDNGRVVRWQVVLVNMILSYDTWCKEL